VLGLRVGGRAFRTVFTPDRNAGGYWVRVPELPGCLTEGNTLDEAKRMARDAIALWLKVSGDRSNFGQRR
jgi:predicted RNase H-like HicB family nuclease